MQFGSEEAVLREFTGSWGWKGSPPLPLYLEGVGPAWQAMDALSLTPMSAVQAGHGLAGGL